MTTVERLINSLCYADSLRRSKPKPKPYLRVEVTRDPCRWGCAVVTFIRERTSTAYGCDGRRYDRLVAIANSGEYSVEILDSAYGVAWSMRRKATG